MRLFLVALFAFAFVGCLDIDSPDGALKCSDVPKRACPEGFYCLAADNTCWRYGHFPNDMADPFHFNPGGPDDMSIPVEADMTADDAGMSVDDLSPPNDDLSNVD